MPTEELVEVQKKLDEAEKSLKELEESSMEKYKELEKERDALNVQAQEGQRAKVRVAVQEAVSKTKLPEPSKKRVVQQFGSVESDEGLVDLIAKAVETETTFLKDLAEAGKVVDLGESKKEEEDGRKALRETLTVSYQQKGYKVEEAEKMADQDLRRRQ